MAGRYQAYPSYRATELEWFGNIPSEWKICAIKHVSTLNPAKSQLRHQQPDVCSFVPMEKLKTDTIILDEIRSIANVYDGYTYFADDDILMAKVTPCFENKNIAIARGMVNGVGFGSSEIYVLRANRMTNNRYLFYRLHEDGFMAVATASMTGAGGLKRVPSEVLNNFLLALPAYEEQSQIANFLDRETAKIDTLIDKQQQLIKLLKEKRQAVISHAVTKGLIPDVPMKDSGVEWLGEVPEHWQALRVKQIASFITSGPRGWSEFISEEGEDIFLQSGDLNNELEIIPLSAKKVIAPQGAEGVRTKLIEGDVVVCITGANTGRVAVVQNLPMTTYINQHLSLVRPVQTKANPKYLGYALSSQGGRYYFDVKQYGLKEGLSLSNVAEAPLALPPLHEQEVIVESLHTKLRAFSKIIGRAEEQIELLEERRTALISAAVTGKIDVREWKPTQSEVRMEATA